MTDGIGADDLSYETDTSFACPYCFETVEIAIDPGGGRVRSYVEDCPVCCRPWQLLVRFDDRGKVTVDAQPAQ